MTTTRAESKAGKSEDISISKTSPPSLDIDIRALLDRISSLEGILNSSPQSDRRSHHHANLPKIDLPSYSLSQNPMIWLSRCTRLLHQVADLPPEPIQIEYLTGLFNDSALVWWEGHCKSNPSCDHSSLETFRDCLRRELIPPAVLKVALTKIDSLKQRSARNIDEYIDEFRAHLYQLPNDDTPEHIKIHWFQKGLYSDYIKSRLSECDHVDVNAAIFMAMKIHAASNVHPSNPGRQNQANLSAITPFDDKPSRRPKNNELSDEQTQALEKLGGCPLHKTFSHTWSACRNNPSSLNFTGARN